MLTYLKRQRSSRKNVKGRYVNILLCSMQLFAPMVIQISMIVGISQEPDLRQIIKAFATLGFIVQIDDMFAAYLPTDIIKNANQLNSSGILVLSKDHNTLPKVWRRLKQGTCRTRRFGSKSQGNPLVVIGQEMSNIGINIWYWTILNLQVILYTYFIGIISVTVQILGYAFQIAE